MDSLPDPQGSQDPASRAAPLCRCLPLLFGKTARILLLLGQVLLTILEVIFVILFCKLALEGMVETPFGASIAATFFAVLSVANAILALLGMRAGLWAYETKRVDVVTPPPKS